MLGWDLAYCSNSYQRCLLGFVQTSQVLPHQAQETISFWILLCAQGLYQKRTFLKKLKQSSTQFFIMSHYGIANGFLWNYRYSQTLNCKILAILYLAVFHLNIFSIYLVLIGKCWCLKVLKLPGLFFPTLLLQFVFGWSNKEIYIYIYNKLVT